MRAQQQNNRSQDGNEWVINGSKIFITNAACEMSLGVNCSGNNWQKPNCKPEYTCFILEHGTKGFKYVPMHKKMMAGESIQQSCIL